MERLEGMGGTIFNFRKRMPNATNTASLIDGKITITKDNILYAYLFIPATLAIPFMLDVTNKHQFMITDHGWIYLGFPKIEPIKEMMITTPVATNHVSKISSLMHLLKK